MEIAAFLPATSSSDKVPTHGDGGVHVESHVRLWMDHVAGWIATLPLSEIRTDVHSLSPHSVRDIWNETGRGGRHDSTIGTVDNGSHQRHTGPVETRVSGSPVAWDHIEIGHHRSKLLSR
jgi:hypothetical protein